MNIQIESSNLKKAHSMNEGKAKEIYFIILYKRKKQEITEELIFLKSDITPENIYTNELNQENGTYFYQVFKFNEKNESSKKYLNYNFEFKFFRDIYTASFYAKENSFIYDIELKKETKIINSNAQEIINQKAIDYNIKFDIFLNALKKNKEEEKKEILYKETIDLYSKKKKDFRLLISLFVQIYEMKNLCPLLIKKFKKIRNRTKEYEEKMMPNKDLEKYKELFLQISKEAYNLINNNGYDPIQFYGIILCYLNYYDHDEFLKIFNKLFTERWEVLYEILLIYFSHISISINKDLDFFVKFFSYTASKKEFEFFEKGLKYIRDIETFISIIDKIKEQIVIEYVIYSESFNPINLKDNLELIKKEKNGEIKTIIPYIESIINYSKEKNVLLIYFTSYLWSILLIYYNKPV